VGTDTLVRTQEDDYDEGRASLGDWMLDHPDWNEVLVFKSKDSALVKKYELEAAHIGVYMNDPIEIFKWS
jgi:hypothetical protein